jgi:ComF family protein
VVAWGEYSGELRDTIHLLKFHSVVSAAEVLAQRMADALAPFIPELQQPVLITAVPLFAAKQRSRGFNQSRLLAGELARRLRLRGIRVEENYALLSRSRATRSQSELNIRQRRANLRGVFASGPKIDAARGRHVLLVDDIVTTGTTARLCAKVLRRKGAEKIWVAAAARSMKNDAVAVARFTGPDEFRGVIQ